MLLLIAVNFIELVDHDSCDIVVHQAGTLPAAARHSLLGVAWQQVSDRGHLADDVSKQIRLRILFGSKSQSIYFPTPGTRLVRLCV